MIEEVWICCAECGEFVLTYWKDGLIPKKEYILVSDWIFHAECWDRKVEQNLP